MRPDRFLQKQQGAGLPVALFIITVLALLVVAMAQLQQRSGDALDLQILSQRAFMAAESGAQVAVTDVLHEGRSCDATWEITYSGPGLTGCRAVLSCGTTDVSDVGGGGGNTLYQFVSTGICGGGAEQASRKVEVRVR
ncbi:hypothetical protein MLC59_08930 [Marinobacter bryozoorum]|uniref:pilus assembly PilX family protein n=1 Tax=Marinobacter bryozoorum TaxID=256324 RepID=UPI002003F9BC|nr:hypothetical protein [Marinobacter bryozoorum]MCK7544291.1 hypothetical protein [Marinobacter bryozoorum]